MKASAGCQDSSIRRVAVPAMAVTDGQLTPNVSGSQLEVATKRNLDAIWICGAQRALLMRPLACHLREL